MQKIKEAVKADALSADNPEAKKDAVRVVRSDFMKRYADGKNAWFFTKLRY